MLPPWFTLLDEILDPVVTLALLCICLLILHRTRKRDG